MQKVPENSCQSCKKSDNFLEKYTSRAISPIYVVLPKHCNGQCLNYRSQASQPQRKVLDQATLAQTRATQECLTFWRTTQKSRAGQMCLTSLLPRWEDKHGIASPRFLWMRRMRRWQWSITGGKALLLGIQSIHHVISTNLPCQYEDSNKKYCQVSMQSVPSITRGNIQGRAPLDLCLWETSNKKY